MNDKIVLLTQEQIEQFHYDVELYAHQPISLDMSNGMVPIIYAPYECLLQGIKGALSELVLALNQNCLTFDQVSELYGVTILYTNDSEYRFLKQTLENIIIRQRCGSLTDIRSIDIISIISFLMHRGYFPRTRLDTQPTHVHVSPSLSHSDYIRYSAYTNYRHSLNTCTKPVKKAFLKKIIDFFHRKS